MLLMEFFMILNFLCLIDLSKQETYELYTLVEVDKVEYFIDSSAQKTTGFKRENKKPSSYKKSEALIIWNQYLIRPHIFTSSICTDITLSEKLLIQMNDKENDRQCHAIKDKTKPYGWVIYYDTEGQGNSGDIKHANLDYCLTKMKRFPESEERLKRSVEYMRGLYDFDEAVMNLLDDIQDIFSYFLCYINKHYGSDTAKKSILMNDFLKKTYDHTRLCLLKLTKFYLPHSTFFNNEPNKISSEIKKFIRLLKEAPELVPQEFSNSKHEKQIMEDKLSNMVDNLQPQFDFIVLLESKLCKLLTSESIPNGSLIGSFIFDEEASFYKEVVNDLMPILLVYKDIIKDQHRRIEDKFLTPSTFYVANPLQCIIWDTDSRVNLLTIEYGEFLQNTGSENIMDLGYYVNSRPLKDMINSLHREFKNEVLVLFKRLKDIEDKETKESHNYLKTYKLIKKYKNCFTNYYKFLDKYSSIFEIETISKPISVSTLQELKAEYETLQQSDAVINANSGNNGHIPENAIEIQPLSHKQSEGNDIQPLQNSTDDSKLVNEENIKKIRSESKDRVDPFLNSGTNEPSTFKKNVLASQDIHSSIDNEKSNQPVSFLKNETDSHDMHMSNDNEVLNQPSLFGKNEGCLKDVSEHCNTQTSEPETISDKHKSDIYDGCETSYRAPGKHKTHIDDKDSYSTDIFNSSYKSPKPPTLSNSGNKTMFKSQFGSIYKENVTNSTHRNGEKYDAYDLDRPSDYNQLYTRHEKGQKNSSERKKARPTDKLKAKNIFKNSDHDDKNNQGETGKGTKETITTLIIVLSLGAALLFCYKRYF